MTENEMVGWHHRLNGHDFKQALGVVDGPGGLVCCSTCGHRVGHDWGTELNRVDRRHWFYINVYNILFIIMGLIFPQCLHVVITSIIIAKNIGLNIC